MFVSDLRSLEAYPNDGKGRFRAPWVIREVPVVLPVGAAVLPWVPGHTEPWAVGNAAVDDDGTWHGGDGGVHIVRVAL